MMLEDQMRDALDDLALRVPPRAGLADTVLREARRRRAKVRLATAGSTVVAVAAGTMFVVADPLATDGPDLDTVGPAAGEPAEDQGQDAPAGPITVDVDQLPAGPAPSVPWYADGVLHSGDVEVPLEGDFSGFRALSEVAGGFVVLFVESGVDNTDGNQLALISRDGQRTVLDDGAVYDVAVSGDGTMIAWAVHDWATHGPGDGPGRTLLRVADARTGDVVYEREQTGAEGSVGVAKGFLPDGRIVLDKATNAPGGIFLWDPAADTVTPWTDYGFTNTVAPGGELAVLTPPNEAADTAPGVVDTLTGELLWTVSPDHYVGTQAFSSDGRHLAVIAAPGLPGAEEFEDAERIGAGVDGELDVPRSVVVLDARSGEPVLTVADTGPGNITWESDGSLVFEVWDEASATHSLVRCSLDGRCELAAATGQVVWGGTP
ncbi:WD40 repeat domain-containing protein [Jiangella alkaliphila]|uniref:PQQ-like domain-containing protein n=1 Tax=Jiangella alkaliphila TaxID=419479 RepID=A0A1H2LMN3_9ACTN|nr:hypothetical protein [Jiangella alkaliphila]SDU82015.1 hypothetical protein SAMN04488563_6383 [Jiangella alkaliphila]